VAGAAVSMLKEQGTLKGIEVREEMPGELPVSIDRAQMEQVMVNILLNARDAMPDGGEILVRGGETEYVAVPAAAVFRRRSDDPPGIDFSRKRKGISIEGMEPFKDGEMIVKLSVADNGSGIVPENLERIFDPFFTTKEPGKGTGLGLTVCQRIIESFGGKIVVESVEGEGSRVTLMLPKAT
jgi:signal transduction histidine kinase